MKTAQSLKTTHKQINVADLPWLGLLILSAGAIVAERYTPLYINNFYVRLLFYLMAASIFILWAIRMIFGRKADKYRLYVLVGIWAVVVGKAALTWGGDWKTQIVLYKNKLEPGRSIEFQMRADPFSFGYRRRIVERTHLLPFFDRVQKTDTTTLDHTVWKRVDERVNDLHLENFTDSPTSH